jgi:hypothetical protein
MKPTSYNVTNTVQHPDGTQTVTYTDQDNAEYTITVPQDANLDQIILGV